MPSCLDVIALSVLEPSSFSMSVDSVVLAKPSSLTAIDVVVVVVDPSGFSTTVVSDTVIVPSSSTDVS